MSSLICLHILIGSAPDKSVYWKVIFLISQTKHLLWVLKRTVSMRRFFGAPIHMFKVMGKEINAILGAQTILIWTYVAYFANNMDPGAFLSGSIVFASIINSCLKCTRIYAADLKSRKHFQDKKYWRREGLKGHIFHTTQIIKKTFDMISMNHV